MTQQERAEKRLDNLERAIGNLCAVIQTRDACELALVEEARELVKDGKVTDA